MSSLVRPTIHFLFFIPMLLSGCGTEPNAVTDTTVAASELTKTWVRNVGTRPTFFGKMRNVLGFDADTNCEQWVRFSKDGVELDAVEFHNIACPAEETQTLDDSTLAIRLFPISKETAEWGETFTLHHFENNTFVEVGQVQLSKVAGARLEELCQISNDPLNAKYSGSCELSVKSGKWESLKLTPQSTTPSIAAESGQVETETTPSGSIAQALARR